MLNRCVDCNDDIVAIQADGAGKYGLHILISKRNIELVSNFTDGRWMIRVEKNRYYAYVKCGDNLVYIHDLITGVNNSKCEERFLKGNNSSVLINNPYVGRTNLVRHINGNGLVNVDENLIISEKDNFVNDIDYSPYLEPCYTFLEEDDIYDVDLQIILNIEDEFLKNEAYETYKKYVLDLKNTPIFRRVNPYINECVKLIKLYEQGIITGDDFQGLRFCINDFFDDYENMVEEYQSHYYFDGHMVILYPTLKLVKANKEHLCCFSGARIRKDSYYVSYRLFIEDFTDKSIYVTPTLCAEIRYKSYFPTTISSLDDFLYKLSKCYELGLDEYYNFATNIKSSNLGIRKIKKKQGKNK